MAAIQDLIGEDNALAGTAVSTAVATNSTVTEVAKIAAIAVVYVLFILILTTDSLGWSRCWCWRVWGQPSSSTTAPT